jgi:excisionase family DNA binding protein
MHNLVLSPIDPEKLINNIADKVMERFIKYLEENNIKAGEPVEKLLTIQEAAEFLNLTVPTLYGKTHRNQIPFSKKGKRVYFLKSKLIEYVNQ